MKEKYNITKVQNHSDTISTSCPGRNYPLEEIENAVKNDEDEEKPQTTKSIVDLANEVIAGKWGNNPSRKQKLITEGYDYNAIQSIVNRKLK